MNETVHPYAAVTWGGAQRRYWAFSEAAFKYYTVTTILPFCRFDSM